MNFQECENTKNAMNQCYEKHIPECTLAYKKSEGQQEVISRARITEAKPGDQNRFCVVQSYM